jgi:concanavalin A-like lectin/glucanase superfamily protein
MVGRGAALLVLGSTTACNALFGIDELGAGAATGGATSSAAESSTTPSATSSTGGSTSVSTGGHGGAESCAYAASVLADQPVGYFRLNEMMGSNAADEMSLQGGHYQGGFNLGKPGPVNCRGDASVSFDAMSGQVELGQRYEFSQGASFTLEAWVNLTLIDTAFRAIISKEYEDVMSERQGYFLWVRSGTGLGFEFIKDSISDVAQWLAVTSGQWLHVVGTYNGTEACLYVNADLKACEPIQNPLTPNSGTFRIGAFSLSQGYLGGSVDEVAIYDTALPPARIQAHYSAATDP